MQRREEEGVRNKREASEKSEPLCLNKSDGKVSKSQSVNQRAGSENTPPEAFSASSKGKACPLLAADAVFLLLQA